MPHTDRLYALSSTHNHPWLDDTPGPGLLIHDAVMAMRWYLTHEREEDLAVAAHVSNDDGATWQDLPPGELLADCERALTERAQVPGDDGQRAAALLRDALAAEAADWLDDRIRYVQPDDPSRYRPRTPTLAAWRRGGQIWALALGTVPHEQILTHLAAQYTDPQPEGPQRLKAAAQDTLDALALAKNPADRDVSELLGALSHMNQLTFGFELGQLRYLAEHAQQNILDHLVAHHPQTAAAAAAHPDPQHPAHQAARTYLHRLSLLGPDGEERLLDDAALDFTEALTAAETAQQTTTPTAPVPEAIPGYPKHLTSDLQAAAQWRLISPAARRAADRTMDSLVHAETTLTEESATAGPERFAHAESQARRLHTDLHQELDELNARHALLMHTYVLAEAEAAGKTASQHAIITAAQATETAHGRPRTTEEMHTTHKALMTEVNAAEDRIARTLGEQRQLTRDALHRLFPQTVSSFGLHQLRSQLIDHSGLGLDAYNKAWHAIGATAQNLERLEARYRNGITGPDRAPVTAKQLEQARTTAQEAEAYFTELQRRPADAAGGPSTGRYSRPGTVLARLDRRAPRADHLPSPPTGTVV